MSRNAPAEIKVNLIQLKMIKSVLIIMTTQVLIVIRIKKRKNF